MAHVPKFLYEKEDTARMNISKGDLNKVIDSLFNINNKMSENEKVDIVISFTNMKVYATMYSVHEFVQDLK